MDTLLSVPLSRILSWEFCIPYQTFCPIPVFRDVPFIQSSIKWKAKVLKVRLLITVDDDV